MSIYTISQEESDLSTELFEQSDPSLNGNNYDSLQVRFDLSRENINTLFFDAYNISYISKYAQDRDIKLRVVTHPVKTNTCYEKARLFGKWNPLNIIKALYFECPVEGHLYAVVVPETGCFMDRSHLSQLLSLPNGVALAKAKRLPRNMSYGTCSPFITKDDLLENGGKVAKIIFDSESLVSKKHDNGLDDFSFGLDHRFSLHLNYYHCYKMLKGEFKNSVIAEDVLSLSFCEKFIRKNGQIKVNYDFKTLNYRTAKFINSIHGYGDVVVENDHLDELDLPEILTSNS